MVAAFRPKLRTAAASLLAVVMLTAACGGTQTRRDRSSKDAVIRVDSAVATAVIIINGRELGTIETLRRGIALSPGTHRLEVRHPSFHEHYELLELSIKEQRVIKVELAERLP